MPKQLIINLLSTLTLIGQIFLVMSIIYLLIRKKIKIPFSKIIKKNHIKFSFIVALIATLGSLFFSEIMLWEPCRLCWYQRILMYPLVILLGIAVLKKDRRIKRYVIPMSVIGLIISA